MCLKQSVGTPLGCNMWYACKYRELWQCVRERSPTLPSEVHNLWSYRGQHSPLRHWLRSPSRRVQCPQSRAQTGLLSSCCIPALGACCKCCVGKGRRLIAHNHKHVRVMCVGSLENTFVLRYVKSAGMESTSDANSSLQSLHVAGMRTYEKDHTRAHAHLKGQRASQMMMT